MVANNERPVYTDRDYQQNNVRRMGLQPTPSDPVFGTNLAADEQGPWQPWLHTVRNEMCWFDENGDMFCVAPCKVGEPCCKSNLHESLLLDGGDVIPTAFDPVRTHVFIDIDNMTADLDLTPWLPTMAGPSVEFRFRKIDASTFSILWTDPVTSITYNYVDRQHEFITLVWDGVAGNLVIA